MGLRKNDCAWVASTLRLPSRDSYYQRPPMCFQRSPRPYFDYERIIPLVRKRGKAWVPRQTSFASSLA